MVLQIMSYSEQLHFKRFIILEVIGHRTVRPLLKNIILIEESVYVQSDKHSNTLYTL